MNDLNSLENQLHSWTPRRPSARLKTRLFGGETAAAPRRVTAPALTLRWLAPSLACLLVMFLALQQHHSMPLSSEAGRPGGLLAGLPSSNPFPLLRPDASHDRNLWERVTFEWTKGGGFNSTMDSLTLFRTNRAM